MPIDVHQLQPCNLWKNFAALNAVPRPSKKEQRVVEFIRNFGQSLDLETTVDAVGNVIIRKPAHPDMIDRKPIVMQSHLDMVCQKNASTNFDFESEGIRMRVENDWVKADGTTLGADNGIGVAAIMSVLESDEIKHPELDALFTIDEETGMTGAMGLEADQLRGDILLNLDTEEDNELTIGCAGGVDVTISGSCSPSSGKVSPGSVIYEIAVRGLKGGHSGMDIHLGRANANKWMNRILWHVRQSIEIQVCRIDGGGLRNAIPRESVAVIAVDEKDGDAVEKIVSSQAEQLLAEYATTDVEAMVNCKPDNSSPYAANVVDDDFVRRLLAAVYACPNGVYRLSPDIESLVQTSNNLARVLVEDGKFQIGCLTRSSVNSERDDLANAIACCFQPLQGEINYSGKYPGWAPRPDSEIVRLMSDLYQEMFDGTPHVAACHAGLECGIIGRNYPEMDMVSFGPNILGAHSPDEKVQISSVQKFWSFLLATLEKIPAKS